MATWLELVAVLGDGVIEAVGADIAIGRLVVDSDPARIAAGDVVLAVGQDTVRSVESLATAIPSGLPIGVVLRGRSTNRRRVIEAAKRHHARFILVEEHTDWITIIERSRDLLGRTVSTELSWDLFEIAAAAAEIIAGPVTIEDSESRIVAYGGDHTAADPARVAAILQRRVPVEVTRKLQAANVGKRLRAAKSAIYVDDVPDLHPRVASAIQSGGETIGTAWALVAQLPPESSLAEFHRCVSLSAVHLVRAANPSTPPNAIDNDGFAALLYGGAGSEKAARTIELAGESAMVAVLAARGGDLGESTRLRARLRARLLALGDGELGQAHVADLNGVLFLILSAARFSDYDHTHDWLQRSVLTQMGGESAARVYVGVGSPGPTTQLPQSRAQAEVAMSVASESVTGRICSYQEVWAQSVVRRLSELPLATELSSGGPLAELIIRDPGNIETNVDTVEAYLLTGGDARAAAERLQVHPNTHRYRMRRINELVDLRLSEIDAHAAIALHIAMLRRATARGLTGRDR